MIDYNTLIYAMSNDDYHAHPAVSSTQCKELLKSPWLYSYNRDNPKEQTPSQAFGSLVHTIVLEIDSVESRYFVAKKPKRTTKEGKARYAELLQECGERLWIDTDEWRKAVDMVYNLSQSVAGKLLLSGGNAEVATFWQDNKTRTHCRAKCDYINVEAGYMVDVKTTSSLASEAGFRATVEKYQYHLSAAMYVDGFKRATGKDLDFYFVVLESSQPYNFGIYKLGADLLARGHALYREALSVYQLHSDTDNFKVPYNNGLLVELVA